MVHIGGEKGCRRPVLEHVERERRGVCVDSHHSNMSTKGEGQERARPRGMNGSTINREKTYPFYGGSFTILPS